MFMGSETQDTNSVKKVQWAGEVHLNKPAGVAEVARLLEARTYPVLVEFCARGTRFTVCLFNETLACKVGHPDCPSDHTFVGLWTMSTRGGGFYAFDLSDYIPPSYLMERLHLHNSTDAANLAAFLMALGHRDGAEAYLTDHVKLYPGHDYLDDRVPEET
jgi:hypothetical protein